jgi:hypothetical protein
MISGEKFQALSEISLYGNLNCIIQDQVQSMNQKIERIDDLKQDDIKKYNIIFVYTHFLSSFFDKFFRHLKSGTVLLTHNSDHCIDEKFLKYLDGNTISKWYCQNRLINHPKLISIPIGLANSQWVHGNQQVITSVRDENNIKECLVYKNFDINTNYDERMLCNNITNSKGIYMSPHTSNEQYWRYISKSCFVISPPGNGIDCHRIWEALYLKTVPIVKYHEAFSQFKHLPILFIDDWNLLNVKTLEEIYRNLYSKTDFNINELDIEFWRKKIYENLLDNTNIPV